MKLPDNHYASLKIEPMEIAQANFTREEYIGFLKGNILKYLLRRKGETRADSEKLFVYASLLKEVYDVEDMMKGEY